MLYQHIDPALVGNDMRMLVSDMAGRATIELKGRELGFDLAGQQGGHRPGDRPGQGAGGARLLLRGGRRVASSCCCATSSRASAAALHRRVLAGDRRAARGRRVTSEATVQLVAKGERVVAVGEGNGPVNALDRALRPALEQTFPELATLELIDFKVRILEGSSRHRRDHPGAGRVLRRHRRHLVHRRGRRERHLRVLARPGRRGQLRPAPGRSGDRSARLQPSCSRAPLTRRGREQRDRSNMNDLIRPIADLAPHGIP